ncbi:MAG: hypothetical protein HPY46_04185 [Candidatus Aminicenantes bacterium]|nr:hypothetical protein [Candidatus Aminicenantes bacterium]
MKIILELWLYLVIIVTIASIIICILYMPTIIESLFPVFSEQIKMILTSLFLQFPIIGGGIAAGVLYRAVRENHENEE